LRLVWLIEALTTQLTILGLFFVFGFNVQDVYSLFLFGGCLRYC